MHQRQLSGTASALMGSMQFAFGAAVSAISGALAVFGSSGLIAVMLCCTAINPLLVYLRCPRRPVPAHRLPSIKSPSLYFQPPWYEPRWFFYAHPIARLTRPAQLAITKDTKNSGFTLKSAYKLHKIQGKQRLLALAMSLPPWRFCSCPNLLGLLCASLAILFAVPPLPWAVPLSWLLLHTRRTP